MQSNKPPKTSNNSRYPKVPKGKGQLQSNLKDDKKQLKNNSNLTKKVEKDMSFNTKTNLNASTNAKSSNQTNKRTTGFKSSITTSISGINKGVIKKTQTKISQTNTNSKAKKGKGQISIPASLQNNKKTNVKIISRTTATIKEKKNGKSINQTKENSKKQEKNLPTREEKRKKVKSNNNSQLEGKQNETLSTGKEIKSLIEEEKKEKLETESKKDENTSLQEKNEKKEDENSVKEVKNNENNNEIKENDTQKNSIFYINAFKPYYSVDIQDSLIQFSILLYQYSSSIEQALLNNNKTDYYEIIIKGKKDKPQQINGEMINIEYGPFIIETEIEKTNKNDNKEYKSEIKADKNGYMLVTFVPNTTVN